ncbi:MAG: coproporphyrinogen III oxidase family protein [Desulfamplus sp.]|nr:coproporphyrinogen III oxidase family protein [Desulfamplus sp.]
MQSFNDAKLGFLNRIHSADEARQTIQAARKAGFKDIGIDLIYGLPGETESIWLSDLEEALQYSPEHISCYMLSYEPDTPMFAAYKRKEISPLEEESVSSLFRLTSNHLVSRGFSHYEISNFAVGQEYQSRHNKKYWEMIPYLGFGPSAHSYDGKLERSWNIKDVDHYISILQKSKLPVGERELLTNEQNLMEMIMLGLRTDMGIDIESFERRSGGQFHIMFERVLEQIYKRVWGETRDGKFRLTLEGRLFMDTITKWFVEVISL